MNTPIRTVTITHAALGYGEHTTTLSRAYPKCGVCGQTWMDFNDDGSVTLGVAVEDEDAAVAHVTVKGVTF